MRAARPKIKSRTSDALTEEIKRVDGFIKQLSQKLLDPELPLSATMRFSIRQNELLAYMRGIRFAIGEETVSFDLSDPET